MSNTPAVRRRVRHGLGGEEQQSRSLAEPLLGDGFDDDSLHSPLEVQQYASADGELPQPSSDSSKITRHGEKVAWRRIFADLIAQWTAWFGNIVGGGRAMLGALGGSVAAMLVLRLQQPRQLALPTLRLTEEQEAHLRRLQERLAIAFDGTNEDHQNGLRALWGAAYPNRKLDGLVSEQWKDMGWQGTDPSTDFRGGGFISLENLIYFARRYPASFRRLLNKEEGSRATWEYPFAVAGLNLTFMLTQLLDLRSSVPATLAGRRFVAMLGDDENAFDDVYCVAFEMLDAQWLAMRASYMEFNVVLQETKKQLDRLLSVETTERVTDLPAYHLLVR